MVDGIGRIRDWSKERWLLNRSKSKKPVPRYLLDGIGTPSDTSEKLEQREILTFFHLLFTTHFPAARSIQALVFAQTGFMIGAQQLSGFNY